LQIYIGKKLGIDKLGERLDIPRYELFHLFTTVTTLYRESESCMSHHQTSKHQCTRLGSVPNLNSQASIPINEGWKPPYHIRKQKTEV